MADTENILEDDNIFTIQIAPRQQDDPGIASNHFDCEDDSEDVDDSGFNQVELSPCGISNMGYMSSESDDKNFAEPSSKTKVCIIFSDGVGYRISVLSRVMHSGPENLKKSSKKNSWNQINK